MRNVQRNSTFKSGENIYQKKKLKKCTKKIKQNKVISAVQDGRRHNITPYGYTVGFNSWFYSEQEVLLGPKPHLRLY